MIARTDWITDGIAARRNGYFAAAMWNFVPFAEPITFRVGEGKYLWDYEGRR
ncbi:MAG: hypothetical protein AAF501_05435 [Pseudomonadota bacterium]